MNDLWVKDSPYFTTAIRYVAEEAPILEITIDEATAALASGTVYSGTHGPVTFLTVGEAYATADHPSDLVVYGEVYKALIAML
jgi:hypothetical protein